MQASRFASIFAALPFGLIATDRQGRIAAANRAVETLLGWRSDEWHGRPLAAGLEQAIADPAQALGWTVALSQALGQGQTTYLNLPVDFRTQLDGNPCVSITGVVAPWPDEESGPGGALAAFHDTAHYKNLAELRARFFSVVAHELGAPVANVAAAADLLRHQLGEAPAAQVRLVQIIQDETARFRRMIGQYLAVSPAQAGSLHAPRNVVTLRPLLQRVMQTFGLRETGHELVLQVPADLPFVEGDADRIQEVLCNLIDNAARYSPAGRRIVLAAEGRGEQVLVCVADEGAGIPAGAEGRIYEPYFRGQPGVPPEGQGVGLYMARTLVKAMGGELWHEPQPEGGSRFCFTLVRAAELSGGEGSDREEDERQDPGH